MSLEVARSVLLWCTVINYAVLCVWFAVFVLGHGWLHRLHGRWFNLSVERFDAIHYLSMAVYKVGVLLFNLVPYLALGLVQRG